MKRRRVSLVASVWIAGGLVTVYSLMQSIVTTPVEPPVKTDTISGDTVAIKILDQLEVKGRAPKNDYSRDKFFPGWRSLQGCDTRNIILNRDLVNVKHNEKCQVVSGLLHDPYTGTDIEFKRGPGSSSAVQIDHVVALSNAWQTGAQQLTYEKRNALANDPLELLAVDGPANQQKSDGDAATWLPSNKPYRCPYVARQIAVKKKYQLWVTPPEKQAMTRILSTCPDQMVLN